MTTTIGRRKITEDKVINQHLHPSGAVLRGEFEELLVQFATSVKLSQLQL